MIRNALQLARAAAEPVPKSSFIISGSKFLVFGVPEAARGNQLLFEEVYNDSGHLVTSDDFHYIQGANGTSWWYTQAWGRDKKFFDGRHVRTVGQPMIGKIVYVPGKGHMQDFNTEMFNRRSEMPGAVVFDGYVRIGLECGAFNMTMMALLTKTNTYAPTLLSRQLNYSYNRADMFVYLSVLHGQQKVTERQVPVLAQKAQELTAKLMESVNAFIDFAHGFSEYQARQAFKLVTE
jgi:hypothetical protein